MPNFEKFPANLQRSPGHPKKRRQSHYKSLLKDLIKVFAIQGSNIQVNYLDVIEPMDVGYMIVLSDNWSVLQLST